MNRLKIFKGKKIIITGHTGFKGSWLTVWLKSLGSNILGISLKPQTKPSNYYDCKISKDVKTIFLDIQSKKKLKKIVLNFKPDFIFHLAAQSIVLKSFSEPTNTWQTNLIGTMNILESLRNLNKKCAVILVTSDKCYKNVEQKKGYKENDVLGGEDPYSASKASTEILIKSYIKSFFQNKGNKIRICSVRAGNVIGGGDWSNYRLLPDCIKSTYKKKIINIRNQNSTRPWQHVLEPLSGYISLALKLYNNNTLHGHAFNFGPSTKKNYSVKEVIKECKKNWNEIKWTPKTSQKSNKKESSLLKLNSKKAKSFLNWESTLSFQETIKFTIDWYKGYNLKKINIKNYTLNQINEYTQKARKKNIFWAKKI
jgi:CDP-glucose 4,6-dehydratase